MPRTLPLALSALVATTLLPGGATADRIGPPPAPRAATAREAELERRIADLEARLAAAEAAIARLGAQPGGGPPGAGPRPSARVEPDPAKVYAIPLDDSPAVGPPAAPVTMVAAVQFPEPYTRKAWPTLQQLRAQYKDELRIVWKLYVVHPRARASSLGACAAAYQGALDDMAAAIDGAVVQTAEDGTPLAGTRELAAGEVRELARTIRLDLRAYDRDLARCERGLERDQRLLTARGQRGVPGFWINGRPLSGARPLESFTQVIDAELAKAKADRARGGKAGDYYERTVVRAGATSP